jgi:hypothetical protein
MFAIELQPKIVVRLKRHFFPALVFLTLGFQTLVTKIAIHALPTLRGSTRSGRKIHQLVAATTVNTTHAKQAAL